MFCSTGRPPPPRTLGPPKIVKLTRRPPSGSRGARPFGHVQPRPPRSISTPSLARPVLTPPRHPRPSAAHSVTNVISNSPVLACAMRGRVGALKLLLKAKAKVRDALNCVCVGVGVCVCVGGCGCVGGCVGVQVGVCVWVSGCLRVGGWVATCELAQ